ncbi:hypothetical protein ACHAPT_003841 [Fusarium lateritium]
MEARMKSRIPVMEQILAATGQPGVSVGVLYRGKVVLNHTFVTAALNVLVNENRISWSDKVADLVPGLRVQDDPSLVDRLTHADLVSHRSGVNSLDQLVQGLDGRILVPKGHVGRLMEELPIRSDIRTEFWYSNVPFSIAGQILEDVGKCGRWDKFL